MFFGSKRFEHNRKTPGLDIFYVMRGSVRFLLLFHAGYVLKWNPNYDT